jgi:ATP-dependent DNA helicase RecQ
VATPAEILHQYWGYTRFRPPQEEIIQAVLLRRDVLAVLPTGAGKSVCFQVPALAQDGLCVVITPLIALMTDQVAQLRKRGISAVAVHAGLARREIDLLLDNCVYGAVKFLYVSPERTQTEIFRERFARMKVNLVAIDEAHCISQWGHDFRPAYLRLAELRALQPGVPVLAVTASATGAVKDEIAASLHLVKPVLFQRSFDRPNLSLVVRDAPNKEKKLIEILQKVPGSAIVYVRSRKAAVTWAQRLQHQQIKALSYHGGMPYAERVLHQQRWVNNQVRVMVATNAFGMGINKADVRVVVHLDLPENPESYYQEAGRAGRDGRRAYAAVLYQDADAIDLRARAELALPTPAFVQHMYQALANYFQLAEGAGQGVSFPVSLEDFCSQFNLKLPAVFAAMRRLEEAGLLEVSDPFYQPARLHVAADKMRLYEFQVAHARFDPIIKTLLRLFGAGLITGFVSISEKAIAQAMKVSVTEVQQLLHQLRQLQILAYEPASETPRVTYLTPRQDAARLPVDWKKMEARAALIRQKAEAMIAYATAQRCRMQMLQEYFEETNTLPCGRCDVCIAGRKKADEQLHKSYRGQILQTIENRTYTLDELEAELQPKEPALFTEVIRDLIEEGILAYDTHWALGRKGSGSL